MAQSFNHTIMLGEGCRGPRLNNGELNPCMQVDIDNPAPNFAGISCGVMGYVMLELISDLS